MRGGIVPELDDVRVTLERSLDDPALHATTASVDEPHLAKAGRAGRVQVLGDDGRNVAGRERVEIELGFDGDSQLSSLNS